MHVPVVRRVVALAFTFAFFSSPAFGQECTAEKLVGTWERVSLLRNALSVQPPDAPLFVKFGSDGYWSMMEMPDRPKVDKPLAQQTAKELFTRFDKVEGGQGTWTLKADGSVLTRRHAVNIAAGGEGSNQDRLCTFEGEILALVGTGANRSPQARFKRLPAQPVKHPIVATWERTSFIVEGKPAQPPASPLVLIVGEDGWFSQTALPTGRKPVGKPMEQWSVDDYVRTFGRVDATRGTYTVQGNMFTRKHVATINPNSVGEEFVTEFTINGENLTVRGTNAAGRKLEATFKRLKPLDTIAK